MQETAHSERPPLIVTIEKFRALGVQVDSSLDALRVGELERRIETFE